MVEEDEHGKGVQAEEDHTSETWVLVPPVVLDEAEGRKPQKKEVEDSEGDTSEEEVGVRLEEVGGLEREYSCAIFLSIFLLGLVIDSNSRDVIVTWISSLDVNCRQVDSLRSERPGNIGSKE